MSSIVRSPSPTGGGALAKMMQRGGLGAGGGGYSGGGGGSSYPYTHASGYDIRCYPDEGAPQNALLAYRDRQIDPNAIFRNRVMGDVALWTWYCLDRQWAEVDTRLAFDGLRGTILQDTDDDRPRPQTNEIDPAVEQTVIALIKRKWKFYANPTSQDPAIKAGAQVATDVANTRLKNLRFDEKRRQHALLYTMQGTGLVYTGVDRPFTALRMVGSPSGVYCHSCNTKLYSPIIPADTLRQSQGLNHLQTVQSYSGDDDYGGDMGEMAELKHCPVCEQQNALSPLDPSMLSPEDLSSGQDLFGRPLGVQEAAFDSVLEIDSVFDYYAQDQGFRQTPDTVTKHARRKIRSLDWVGERYPHLVHLVRPDPIAELVYNDPMVGAWCDYNGYFSSIDARMLDYHVNVDELWEDPSFKHPFGRWMRCVRDVVLEEGPLLLEGKDGRGESIWVARANESAARFKIAPHVFYGRGLPAGLISPQNRMNGLDAQYIEIRERHGSPTVVMPHDMWWDDDNAVSLNDAWGIGKILRVKPSLSMPDVTGPQVVPGQLMSTDGMVERNVISEFMQRTAGPKPATVGNAPKNIGTTSGLEALQAADQESQIVREDELTGSHERAVSHIVRMESVLRVDEAEKGVLGPNKVWSYAAYRGLDIQGQCDIVVERGPAIPKGILTREAAREAVADKVIDPNASPYVKRRLLEYYGLDQELAPDLSNQVDHAERVFADWRDRQITRTQDTIDDPTLHHLVLSTFLRSEEMERYADACSWDDINRGIAGWQDELVKMMMLEQISSAFYGGRLENDEERADAFTQATIAYDQQVSLFNRQSQISADANTAAVAAGPDPATGAVTPPIAGPLPPTPPPQPTNFPPLLQDKIKMVWLGLLGRRGSPYLQLIQAGMNPGEPVPDPATGAPMQNPLAPAPGAPNAALYMDIRCLVDAYRLTAFPLPIPTAPAPGMPAQGGDPNAPATESGGTAAPAAPPSTGALSTGGPH